MNFIHLHRKSSTLHLQRIRPQLPISTSDWTGSHVDCNAPRTAGYLDAIEKLAPLVEEHRAAFDRDRRLPDTVFRALAEAGLFRLWLPAAMGAPNCRPRSSCAWSKPHRRWMVRSAGWWQNGGGMSRVGGYLPESIAGEWFDDPWHSSSAPLARSARLNPLRAAIHVAGALAVRQRRQSCHPIHGIGCRARWQRQQPTAGLLLLRARAGDHS